MKPQRRGKQDHGAGELAIAIKTLGEDEQSDQRQQAVEGADEFAGHHGVVRQSHGSAMQIERATLPDSVPGEEVRILSPAPAQLPARGVVSDEVPEPAGGEHKLVDQPPVPSYK